MLILSPSGFLVTRLSKIVSLTLFLFNHLAVEKAGEEEVEEERELTGSVDEFEKDAFWSLSILPLVIFVK